MVNLLKKTAVKNGSEPIDVLGGENLRCLLVPCYRVVLNLKKVHKNVMKNIKRFFSHFF